MRISGLGAGSILQYMRTSHASTQSFRTAYLNAAKTATSGLREHAEKLTESNDDSMFAKAEKTGNTKAVVSEVKSFVEDYNSMISNMSRIGGTTNNIYKARLSSDVISAREDLQDIGITANRDGTLKLNEQTLKNAELEDLKDVFEGASSFAGKASVKSIYVESGVASSMAQNSYQSLFGGYGSFGFGGYNMYSGLSGYGSSSLYSSLLGNYFNTFM